MESISILVTLAVFAACAVGALVLPTNFPVMSTSPGVPHADQHTNSIPEQWQQANTTTILHREIADMETKTDVLLFYDDLETFMVKRDAQDPPELNWHADGCSHSPENPLGFPFHPACVRHDFGYRNYKRQGRFNNKSKQRIDVNFHADLRHQCRPLGPITRFACVALAWAYYLAVRAAAR